MDRYRKAVNRELCADALVSSVACRSLTTETVVKIMSAWCSQRGGDSVTGDHLLFQRVQVAVGEDRRVQGASMSCHSTETGVGVPRLNVDTHDRVNSGFTYMTQRSAMITRC